MSVWDSHWRREALTCHMAQLARGDADDGHGCHYTLLTHVDGVRGLALKQRLHLSTATLLKINVL